ncbi:hypothetical protein [Streptomyces taklimakanensis]|uniref:hypothetical protein n=1 Tax=Streptomyces taklimakanensis TaxID=2569853 RepID=UPI00192E4146|nr:hypothetical protein [Streptomyces taklimakanensis]
MNSASIPSQKTGGPASGATALGELDARGGDGGHRHHRHLLGDAVRAISVFAGAVFDVAVRGDHEQARDEHEPHQGGGGSAAGVGGSGSGRLP